MEQDKERALRLRDTKRRHRARQKEYTVELEQRLRVLEQHGVQATIEVQLAARKVAQENARLLELLRHVGVDESTIGSWTATQQDPNLPSDLMLPGNAGPEGATPGKAKASNQTKREPLVKISPPRSLRPVGFPSLGPLYGE